MKIIDKLILVTVLMGISFNVNAKQERDSVLVNITFEAGFFIGKKVQIKLNDEVVFNKRIKTISQLGYAESYDIFFHQQIESL